jgi:hypothetical protein
MPSEGEEKRSGHEGVWVRGFVGVAGSMFSSESRLMHGEAKKEEVRIVIMVALLLVVVVVVEWATIEYKHRVSGRIEGKATR